MKTTLKELKQYMDEYHVLDVTKGLPDDMEEDDVLCESIQNGKYHVLVFAVGTYGISGAIFQNEIDGTLFGVTARSTVLFTLYK